MKILNGELDKGWTTILDDSKKRLKIQIGELDENSQIPVIRAEGIQDHDVLTCFRCYCNSDNRK